MKIHGKEPPVSPYFGESGCLGGIQANIAAFPSLRSDLWHFLISSIITCGLIKTLLKLMGLLSVSWTFSDHNCLVFNLSNQFKKKKILKMKPPINYIPLLLASCSRSSVNCFKLTQQSRISIGVEYLDDQYSIIQIPHLATYLIR